MEGNDAIQIIKTRINIADYIRRYIELRQKGSSLVAPCPFHQEKTPSFHVNEEKGTFYCFGCQASGDIFEFSMRANGYDFREALEHFAEELNIPLSRAKFTQADKQAQQKRQQKSDGEKMHRLAQAHYVSNLKRKEAFACNAYIQERGISEEISSLFGLGYSLNGWRDLAEQINRAGYQENDAIACGLLSQGKNSSSSYDRFRNRLMFPIFSLTGQVVAFGGRIIPEKKEDTQNTQEVKREEAKYINSSDTIIYKKGEHLYGLYQARKAIGLRHSVLLTEGYMDVITLHQFGFDNAVGVLGTSLTDMQIKRISGFCSKAELLFDGDKAGRQAAFRSAQMLLLAGLECKVVLFPEKEDIDSLLRQENGLSIFASLRENAEEGLFYLIRTKKEESLLAAITWAKEFLKSVQIPEIISRYATIIANELGIDEAEIRHQVRKSTQKMIRTSPVVQGQESTFSSKQEKSLLVQNKDLQRDRLILTFAVRYPKGIPKLQQMGADIILKSDFARDFWNILTQNSPENVFSFLNSQQKNFWAQCREGNAPPCNDEEGEFFAVHALVKKYQMQVQKQSISAALRQGKTTIETQSKYLCALEEEASYILQKSDKNLLQQKE